MKILVLGTSYPSKHLVKAIEDNGHQFDHFNPNDLMLYVSEKENGYDRIYNGSSDLSSPERLKAKEYDAVVSRIGNGLEYGSTILQHLTESIGVYCPQTAAGLLTAKDKIRTTIKLSSHGVKVPLTMFAKQPVHVKFITDKLGGLPIVAKTLSGSQGVGVMICKDAEQTNTSLESFHKLEVDVLLQRYIESGAKDIRVIVVGDKVVSAMRRTGKKDFRANISQGGSGEAVELSEADQALCIKASQVLGLEFSGVDLIKDQDENSYVVEVNGNPGSKIIDITGHNYFQDLVEHIEKKVGVSSKKEETPKEDGKSPHAQLASLEIKQARGEKMSVNEVALMGTLRRMIRAA